MRSFALAALAVGVLSSTASSEAPAGPVVRHVSGGHVRLLVDGYQTRFDGFGPEAWARRARFWKRAYLVERRRLLSSPSAVEAINLACATYGYCSTLWRKARCETGGTFDRFARNPSGASGLFQFLPSTFASTPYARLSIWSPYAQALAAGWMHAQGRGGEWECR